MPKARNDKKFLVKLWVSSSRKSNFRSHCIQHHLSMMFVGEQFLVKVLTDLNDEQLNDIISKKIFAYNSIKDTNKMLNGADEYQTLGIRLINDYWQKLGYFAVLHDTSIAKIASCIFDYCITAFEMREVWTAFGLTFKKRKKKNLKQISERLSDW